MSKQLVVNYRENYNPRETLERTIQFPDKAVVHYDASQQVIIIKNPSGSVLAVVRYINYAYVPAEIEIIKPEVPGP